MNYFLERSSRDVNYYIGVIIENLQKFYLRKSSTNTQEDFKSILEKARQVEDADGDAAIIRIANAVLSENSSIGDLTYLSMNLSLVYLRQAVGADEAGQKDAAWTCIADAMFWSGACIASIGVDSILEKAEEIVKSAAGRKARDARTMVDEPLRKLALKLLIEKKPKEKGWKSLNSAAKAIAPDILACAKQEGIYRSPDRIDKTVFEWLQQLPEAQEHFPPPKKAPKDRAARRTDVRAGTRSSK